MIQLYAYLVVCKNKQLSKLLLLLFIAISHLGFSQNDAAFKKQIGNISNPLLKVETILNYTDSLLWNENKSDNIPIYLDEVLEICKTADCGEAVIHAKISKLDFVLLKGQSNEEILSQLKSLLADPGTKSPQLKAYIHHLLGLYFLIRGYSENEFNHFLEGVHILESGAPDDRRLGLLYNYTAVLYNYKSLADSCFYFSNKALHYFQNNADTAKIVLVYLVLNNWHLSNNNMEEAFKSILAAKKLSQEYDLKDGTHYDILIGLGFFYKKRKEYAKAIAMAEEGLERIFKGTTMTKEERAEKLWNLYMIKGRTLVDIDQAGEGLLFIQKSIAVFRDNDLYPSLVLYSELYEIEAHLKLRDFEKSQLMLNDFISGIESNPSYEIYNVKVINLLTQLYKSSNTKPKEAELPILEEIIKRVIDKTQGQYNYDQLTAYKLAALLQVNANKKAGAIASYDKINEIKDSIWSHEKTKAVDKLLIAYQSKEQKQEIALQKERLEKAATQQKLLTVLLFVLFLLVVVAILFFWERKKHINNLEQKVSERTYDLKTTNKELVDNNEELERFAYITSHDLKEPLRNIISFIGLLDKKNLGADSNTKSYFSFIKKSSIHMSRLIEDVLAFSLLKKTTIVKKSVDIKQTITKVQETISESINEKNVQFKISALPIIETDPSMLYIVFKNLIENAIKYNENDKPIIEIDYNEGEQFHWFSVSDNGIGIEDEYFNQIFEMFKRLHNKNQYAGTGIGLAICKRTVKYLGGEITVTSKLNEGSVFNFSIPK